MALSAAVALASSAGPAIGQELPKKASRRLEQGERLLERGNFPAAIERFEQALDLAGGPSVAIGLRLVRAHLEAGERPQAVRLATEIQDLPGSPDEKAELAFLVGRCYYESAWIAGAFTPTSGELPEKWEEGLERAERSFLRAEETAPGAVPEAQYFLGRIHERRGDVASAERFFRGYLDRSPEGRYRQEVEQHLALLPMLERPLSEPVNVGGAISPPKAIYAPQPQYTQEARKRGVQGEVVFRVVINPYGEVTHIEILKGLPGLTEATMEAAMKWRFEPPRDADGEPISVYYTLVTTFQISR